MLRRSFPLFLLVLLVAAPALAQRSLTPHDLERIQSVSSVVMAPDGDHVAFLVSVPADPLETNAPARRALHLLDVDSGQTTELLGADLNPGGIQWTPDGSGISFLARAEGDAATALHVIDFETGAMRRAVHHPTSVGTYAWSPDGQRVAFIASMPRPEMSDAPYRPELYEEGAIQRPVHLAVAFAESPASTLFTDGTAYALAWHPTKNRLAVSVAPDPLVDSQYVRQQIRIYDVESGMPEVRIDHRGKKGGLAFSPDGDLLAFLAGENINDPAVGRLFVVPAEATTPTDVLPGLMGHVTDFAWLDDDTIRYTAAMGTETVAAQVDADGSDRRTLVPAGKAIMTSLSLSMRGDAAFAAHTPAHPSEVYVMENGDKAPSRATVTNPWLANIALAPQETVTHTASDGLELEGVLIRPLDPTDGPVPFVMLVHGGPESHVSNGWITNYSRPGQTLAARGIAAFYPNYRGSTGRGVAFSLTSQGDPAGKEFDDLIDAADHFIATGLADPDKIGVAGGSYGGYATAWLSTKYSDRIAAGVMFVGISNKVSKVGTTDIPDEEYFVHARKRPWDNWQLFLERSPVYHAEGSTTPLLIAHGADDPRVHPTQSMEMYRHLKLRGEAPVRLVFYPGEGHGNRRATARLDFHLRTLRWFEHYLQGAAGEPPAFDLDLAPDLMEGG